MRYNLIYVKFQITTVPLSGFWHRLANDEADSLAAFSFAAESKIITWSFFLVHFGFPSPPCNRTRVISFNTQKKTEYCQCCPVNLSGFYIHV
jgi:hypothetical protein